MKKICRIIANGMAVILFVIMFLVAMLMLTGHEFYVVKSGSMEPAIETGSLCMIEIKTPYETIKEGDVIAFESPLGKVTHRVTKVTDDGLQTKGDANKVPDNTLVTKNNYRGKTITSIPKIGYALGFLTTMRGKIIALTGLVSCVLLGMLLDESEKEPEIERKMKASV